MGKTKTTQEFIQDVKELVGSEYTVLGTYEHHNKKILLKHNCSSCNYNEFEMTPKSFMSGQRCPIHAGNIKKTPEQFSNEVYKLVGSEFSIMEKYKSAQCKIKFRHNCDSCNNYEFEMKPNAFLTGQRCPKCSGRMRKTKEQFCQEVYDLVGEEYSVIGEYKNNKCKIEMRHNICNSNYAVTPKNFLKGYRCPICSSSHGEKCIKDFLERNNIKYNTEYKINECRNQRPLPFDFAIFDNEGNLQFLIEYQGKQHFEYIPFFFKDDSAYINRVIADSIKRAFCEYNNIRLVEISYQEYDRIEEILEREFYEDSKTA